MATTMLLRAQRHCLHLHSARELSRPRLTARLSTSRARGLRVYDSLQGVKRPLNPKTLGRKDGKVGVVTMYVCGPTVYAPAHLGHARTYVHFDAIRRVLSEQLGCVVGFFMNITDVDDKIVERAKAEGTTAQALAKRYEEEFWKDMGSLGVERPVYSPRATEHIGAIIRFIQQLEREKLCYQGESGSVYFDTRRMESLPDNPYGALDPSRVQHSSESICTINITDSKKDPRDFVLWKVSKEKHGEDVSWESPWGAGRPGWHIECSAMIEATAGQVRGDGRLDVHGGGIDLRFPHHENERSQSQSLLASRAAKCGDACLHPWTSIFLHTGHLNLKGHKMSKSLKNFITIGQVLRGDGSGGESVELTPRQLRLFFLMYKYGSSVDFAEQSCHEAKSLDQLFFQFFQNVSIDLAQPPAVEPLDEKDIEVLKDIQALGEEISEAFLDDFDFPRVLSLLRVTVNKVNKYMAAPTHKPGPVRIGAQAVEDRLRLLGIGGGIPDVKAAVAGYTGAHCGDKVDDTAKFAKAVDIIVEFRHRVRQAVRSDDAKAEIYRICDEIRDSRMHEINVQIEDKPGISVWKRTE